MQIISTDKEYTYDVFMDDFFRLMGEYNILESGTAGY